MPGPHAPKGVVRCGSAGTPRPATATPEPLGNNHPSLVSKDSQLNPITDIQLGKRPSNMSLNSSLTQKELPSDLSIRLPLSNSDNNLPLPHRQPPKLGKRNLPPRISPSSNKMPNKLPSSTRREHNLTPSNNPNSGDNLLRRPFLEQKPTSTSSKSIKHILIEIVSSKHQHLRRRRQGHHQPSSGKPIHPPHPDVHEHHIRRVGTHPANSLVPIPDLPDNDDVRRAPEDHRQPMPHERIVIDEQHPQLSHPNMVVREARGARPGP
jgi:hypothetical protein